MKNTNGISRIEANVSIRGIVTVNRVVITNYKDTNFGKCTKFTKTGQCMSCKNNES